MQHKKVIQKLKLYSPHEKQLEFHNCKARYRVVCFGRQAGKSTACNNELLKKAWENPNSILWFISPTYDSARIMFRRACMALGCCPEIFKDNKAELMIELINGSKIFYKSGEVFQNLRTETLNGVVIDEVRNQHPDLFTLVINPMLSTTKGWAVFISTPNGFDHFYDLYNYAEANIDNGWYALRAPSTCNPLIDQKEIDIARSIMSEAQFAQEYLAEFRDLTSGKAYVNFGDHNLSTENPFWADGPIHPSLPIIVGLDFNLSPMAWTLGQKRVDDFYWFDEIHLKSSHTQEASQVLVSKLKELNHKPGVIIAGDASSKAGQRAAASKSDYDILCMALDEAKIKWTNVTPDSNPAVKDRVNNLNAKLKAADGSVHLWLNPKTCPMLKRDFERVVWRNGSGGAILDQTTNPDLTHQSDGVGYAAYSLSPIKRNNNTTALRVITR